RSPAMAVSAAQATALRHPLKRFRLGLKARVGFWPCSRTRDEFNGLANRSEGESKPDRQGSFVRQSGRQVKRVELIVPVGEVQQPHGQFRVPSPKAVSGKSVELPELVARKIRRVTAVALLVPDRLETEEKARRVIDDSEKLQLMKNGLFVLLEPEGSNHDGRGWNVREAPFQFRAAKPITCSECEFITNKLVQRDRECPLLEVEQFAGGRR